MPRDLNIDAETYAARRATFQREIDDAQHAYELAAFAADGENTSEVKTAKARLNDAQEQLQALGGAWSATQTEIVRQETAQREANKKANVAAVQHAEKAAKNSGAKVDQCLLALGEALTKHNEDRSQFHESVRTLVTGTGCERRTMDALSHRLEGAVLLGHLYAAGARGLDFMDEIDAARQFAEASFEEFVADRIDTVLNGAAHEFPELKESRG